MHYLKYVFILCLLTSCENSEGQKGLNGVMYNEFSSGLIINDTKGLFHFVAKINGAGSAKGSRLGGYSITGLRCNVQRVKVCTGTVEGLKTRYTFNPQDSESLYKLLKSNDAIFFDGEKSGIGATYYKTELLTCWYNSKQHPYYFCKSRADITF